MSGMLRWASKEQGWKFEDVPAKPYEPTDIVGIPSPVAWRNWAEENQSKIDWAAMLRGFMLNDWRNLDTDPITFYDELHNPELAKINEVFRSIIRGME
jgi:hypothetical protein